MSNTFVIKSRILATSSSVSTVAMVVGIGGGGGGGGSDVYQPTTVTFESSPGEPPDGPWWRPAWILRRPPALPVLAGFLVLALLAFALGLKILIDGSTTSSAATIVLGTLLIFAGVSFLGILVKLLILRRRWVDGKQGIEAGGGHSGTSLGAPNPSTDPLVSAQYVPVRDAPPADDERRQLMDNKECLSSAEESDRMLESDPRIVLRPLKNVDT